MSCPTHLSVSQERNVFSLERGIAHKGLSLKKPGRWSCSCLLGRYSVYEWRIILKYQSWVNKETWW